MAIEGAWRQKTETAETGEPSGWSRFADPTLARLTQRALVANTDLAIAASRVRQAQAARAATIAASGANLSTNIGADRQGIARRDRSINDDGARAPALRNVHRAELQATYELDWLGRNRLSLAAQDALQLAANEDLSAARIAVVATIAEAYFDVLLAYAQHEIATQALELVQSSEVAEARRVMAGVAEARALRERRELRVRTETQIQQAEAAISIATKRIALLIGEPAHTFVLPARVSTLNSVANELYQASLLANQPAHVIEERPDVRAAWQRAIAANKDADRAVLERFPRITLTTSAGFASEVFRRWLQRDAFSWIAGARVTAPIFDAGRSEALSQQADATRDERYAEYRRAVLTALQEVASALTLHENAHASLQAAHRIADQRDGELARAVRTQRAGLISRLMWEDTVRAALDARDEVARAQRSYLQAHIASLRAIGQAP